MQNKAIRTPLTAFLAILVLFAQAVPLHSLVYCNMQDATVEDCVCGDIHPGETFETSVSEKNCCSLAPATAKTPALEPGSCCDLQIVSKVLTCTLPDVERVVSPLLTARASFDSPTLSYRADTAESGTLYVPQVSHLELSVFLC